MALGLKYRHELKYEINPFEHVALRQQLRVLMRPDCNTRGDGAYRINSLYFDNYNDRALKEKLDGIANREKFRIRYYEDDLFYMRLEKKQKCRGLCLKSAAPMEVAQVERLLGGDTSWMPQSREPLIQELYVKMKDRQLRPKTVVTYRREAYVFPVGNVRITFDMDIRSGLYSTDFLSPDLTCIPVQDPSSLILEVKYDEFLPEVISNVLQLGSRRAQAFSKYAGSRSFE